MRKYEILWYTKNGEIGSAFYEAKTQQQAFNEWENDHKHFLEVGSIKTPFFIEEVISHPFMTKYIEVSMENGTEWRVPLHFIIKSHAKANKSKFDNEIGRSILEGTIPYFERNPFHIMQWVRSSMSYDDFLQGAMNITPEISKDDLLKSMSFINSPSIWGWSTEK